MPRDINTIGPKDTWASFSKHIFGQNKPSDVQYTEMRRAFHAGYISAFTDLVDKIAAMPEVQGMTVMSRIHTEINQYMVELHRGEA